MVVLSRREGGMGEKKELFEIQYKYALIRKKVIYYNLYKVFLFVQDVIIF